MQERFVSRLAAVAAALMALVFVSVAARAADAQPLVTPAWLNEHLKDSDLVVLDIRSDRNGGGQKAYAEAHIPGSVFSDYDKAGWRVTRNNVPFMVPSAADLEKLIGSLGIDQDSHVVVVSTGENVTDFGASARIYWTLKYAGVKKLSILDGGIAAWKQAGLPFESGEKAPSPKTFTASVDNSILALASDVEKINGSGGAALVDARPASFFLGKEKAPASQAYGHIPGALNVDSASFFDAKTSRLKSKAELEQAADTVPAGPTVSYCNTGHWAATDWFVLHEVLGRQEARLYAGSMVEWTSSASRPIASSRTKWDDIKKSLGMGL
ncbi:sulfurtransferase [Pseudolabrys taiwanensis]|uniref:Sulfurtransferase n=1 Tax=Pseudolabrys taiwanensis TaxID=331696 RepID=A0A346A0V6_9HYPH|nr:sulfurtransferase [Pseudolabrys taiwanensis]AXK82803.1 sulfurtransferase [Pseudolabrys taiwanensis]